MTSLSMRNVNRDLYNTVLNRITAPYTIVAYADKIRARNNAFDGSGNVNPPSRVFFFDVQIGIESMFNNDSSPPYTVYRFANETSDLNCFMIPQDGFYTVEFGGQSAYGPPGSLHPYQIPPICRMIVRRQVWNPSLQTYDEYVIYDQQQIPAFNTVTGVTGGNSYALESTFSTKFSYWDFKKYDVIELYMTEDTTTSDLNIINPYNTPSARTLTEVSQTFQIGGYPIQAYPTYRSFGSLTITFYNNYNRGPTPIDP